MTGSIATASALCQVTVPVPLWKQDVLLQLILQVTAASNQVKVSMPKKGSTMELTWCDVKLTQRNSILRALAAYVLHHALDRWPLYLLGGHSTGRGDASSAMVTTWMSMADQWRSSKQVDAGVLAGLETHLTEAAFLIPSATPTLADMDVCLALLQQPKESSLLTGNWTSVYPQLARWMRTVHATMTDLAAGQVELPALPSVAPPTPMLPVFYYGTEDVAAILKAPKKVSAAAPAPAKGGAAKAPAPASSAKQDKKEAAKKKKAAAAPTPPASDDFTISALDIRVGKIVKVWPHPEADKLYCEEIDLGDGIRQIASGLRPHYPSSDDLLNRHVLVLCNLKKRNLVGFPSHGMVLCATSAEGKVEFVVPPEGSAIGERVVFAGHEDGQPEPENKIAKKKVFEKLAPDLGTDGTGQVVWKGAVARTSQGVIKSVNAIPNAKVS